MEKRAVKFVALASKTYVCVGRDDSVKMSCKGVNKKTLMNKDPYDIYDKVLTSGQADGSTNAGFRVLKDRIFTYSCYRQAFPYFYVKRNCVTECGTYTEPYYNLVLNPVPKLYVCVYSDIPTISMDHLAEFEMEDLKFQTIRQAHCYMKFKSMFLNSRKGKRQVATLKVRQHMFQVMKDIMTNTDAYTLHRIENQLIPQEDFYVQEFDILYSILNNKIDKYPELSEQLLPVKGQLVVNTCRYNCRLGTGVPFRQVRWDKVSFLYGSNKYGHVIMSTAMVLGACMEN